MKLTLRMCLEIGGHEAVIRQTYLDSVGVETWSVGLTAATGHAVARYKGTPAPLQHCLNVYVWALDEYAEHVREVFTGYPLTEAEFTAALSFCWNLGAGNLRRASWVRLWKEGKTAEARKAFMLWVKPPEITTRRKKECALFFDGRWSTDGKMTEFTRVTKRGTPDWTSGKRVDVRAEMQSALDTLGKGGVPVAGPGVEVEDPTPTLSVDAVPTPKPAWQSTTNLSAFGAFAASVLGALQSLNPWVAGVIVVTAAVCAVWIIRERRIKARELGV